MKAKTVAEYMQRKEELREAEVRVARMRKRVAEYIETQLEVTCANLPIGDYGSHFDLWAGRFKLRAIPGLPGGIAVEDGSGSAYFYLDILRDRVVAHVEIRA